MVDTMVLKKVVLMEPKKVDMMVEMMVDMMVV